MTLIDKIKELFKPILAFDDLCEIEWGKQDLCRDILNLIEDHEPEPPTVRPMSENSKRKLLKDFLEHVEAEIDYLQCEPSILIDSYIESLLPNPDDIKL